MVVTFMSNKNKTNKIVDFSTLNSMVVKSIGTNANLMKLYISSDAKSQQYSGIKTFSVNLKSRDGYVVYGNIENRDLLVNNGLITNDITEVNNNDITKNQLRNVRFNFGFDFELVKKCLQFICTNTK